MAKIYRRENLVSGVTPKKKNEKNRKHSGNMSRLK